MSEATVRDDVLCVHAGASTRWLVTGWNGGYRDAPAAYNATVPEGWTHDDLSGYVAMRRERAALEADGPMLLTGVDQSHARVARLDGVAVYATVGLSNPAALPEADGESPVSPGDTVRQDPDRAGTVNLVVTTNRALADGTLATLLGVAVEAKAATLQAATGFPGTTTDAVAVGTCRDGDPAEFGGSGTAVGDATRTCVRDAVRASLASRYPDGGWPDSVADAAHGVVTDRSAGVETVPDG